MTDQPTQPIPLTTLAGQTPYDQSIDLPAPQNPRERLIYLAVIMGVAAVLTIGLAAAWVAVVLQGDSSEFPPTLQNLLFASLAFLFGGGIAARVR